MGTAQHESGADNARWGAVRLTVSVRSLAYLAGGLRDAGGALAEVHLLVSGLIRPHERAYIGPGTTKAPRLQL